MDTLSYKTQSANKETVKKNWLLIDAEGEILGRLASKVSKLIRGKHKPNFTPHVDCGDNIVIINADKVSLTGDKESQKKYIRYTGYPGGRRETPYKEMLNKKPTYIVEKAVKGMLPKTKLGRAIFKNLYVYTGVEHPHTAQKPNKIDIKDIK